MSHLRNILSIDLWRESLSDLPCACPWRPTQSEPREDVIPWGWLEAFRWETPRSLCKLLPPSAFLPCQTPETQGNGCWEKRFFLFFSFLDAVTYYLFLFLAILWCVYALALPTSELITAARLRFPRCVCVYVSNLSPVGPYCHHCALIYYMVWFCQHWYQPNSLRERERKMRRVKRMFSFQW